MYEKAHFPRTTANEIPYDVLNSIRESEEPVNVLIYGDSKVGKSVLASNASKKFHEKESLFCGMSDIVLRLRLTLEEEEAFFDRIGSAPVLFLDNFETAFDTDAGSYMVALLLQERQRQNFSTILISRKSLDTVPYDEVAQKVNPEAAETLKKDLAAFTEYEIKPLDAENRRQAIAEFVNLSSDGTVTMSEEAIADIEQSIASIADIETLIKHIATNAREQKIAELNTSNIESLLTKNSIVEEMGN